ncbi:hypothetical protein AVEN_47499-1 [Araneus ventricosus]|uniref:Uncharacterized protein n=1 Tax=Araneus ventricosus TaxID=182803 RepID=A0A4Y2FG97_ARAVE|nr:hypothetical protein AVEN_47499-1 [Araneus ventricosus]
MRSCENSSHQGRRARTANGFTHYRPSSGGKFAIEQCLGCWVKKVIKGRLVTRRREHSYKAFSYNNNKKNGKRCLVLMETRFFYVFEEKVMVKKFDVEIVTNP